MKTKLFLAVAAALTSVTVSAAPFTVNGKSCTNAAVTITSVGTNLTVPTTCLTTPAPTPTPTPIPPPVIIVVPPISTCSTSDCTIEGDVIPTPSRTVPGSVAPYRYGRLNGAGSVMNAYAADNVATKCSNTTPPITRLWQHNINLAAYASNGANDYPYLATGEAMTWRFTAPAEGSANIMQYNEGTQVPFVSGFMTLSQNPCDFDVSKVTKNACYSSEAYGLSIYYRATNGNTPSYECKIVPGQTYYLNLRMQDARPAANGGKPKEDSCSSPLCGGYVQIR